MFNTTIHKTENHDLAIANKKGYERRISGLASDLHKSVTPETLHQAVGIADKFKRGIVLSYCSTDNSLLDFICCESPSLYNEIVIAFNLNGHGLTVSVDKRKMMVTKDVDCMMADIRKAIAEKIAEVCPVEQIIGDIL